MFKGDLADRHAIDVDSTAVLAFDDGTRIPCDRFVMRCFSAVVRRLLEDVECVVDGRGRTVLPIPSQPSGPYWAAVDMLHGALTPWRPTPAQVVRLMECMEYLGVTVYDAALADQLWRLVQDASPQVMIEHAPRLLATSCAPAVVRALVRKRPVWADFRAAVLATLQPDARTCEAIVSHASHHFPAELLVGWALDACEGLTPDAALRLAALDGRCHASTVGSVFSKVSRVFRERGWDDVSGAISGQAVMRLVSIAAFVGSSPSGRPHGSIVNTLECTSVCVSLDGRLPSKVRPAAWLAVSFCQDGRMDLCFDAAHLAAPHVDLRIMCFDDDDASEAGHAEAWYGVAITGQSEPYTLGHATPGAGDHAAVADMLRLRLVKQLRLDFFHGAIVA